MCVCSVHVLAVFIKLFLGGTGWQVCMCVCSVHVL